ncbi:MAG: hypothetical protein MJK15_13485 [Colwellia sp.]|nr:hypothetical protein [Colwellia sp.]
MINMPTCIEIAVFEVAKSNLARVLEVSETLFSEINAEQQSIIAHEILTKVDLSTEKSEDRAEESSVENTPELAEVCWHLTWANAEAVQASKSKWSTYPSSGEIERLVGKKLYYSHFVSVIAKQ